MLPGPHAITASLLLPPSSSHEKPSGTCGTPKHVARCLLLVSNSNSRAITRDWKVHLKVLTSIIWFYGFLRARSRAFRAYGAGDGGWGTVASVTGETQRALRRWIHILLVRVSGAPRASSPVPEQQQPHQDDSGGIIVNKMFK